MTNREAIEILEKMIPQPRRGDGKSMTHLMITEANTMAIKALEQQSCEDCISRQAVLDIINFEDEWLFDAKSHNADTKIAFSGLESRVKALPSVTPKYTDEEIDRAQAVEQAYVDKMVELTVEEWRKDGRK